jgi:hypothetical protein
MFRLAMMEGAFGADADPGVMHQFKSARRVFGSCASMQQDGTAKSPDEIVSEKATFGIAKIWNVCSICKIAETNIQFGQLDGRWSQQSEKQSFSIRHKATTGGD